jgi:hypothetical protein
MYAAFRPPFKVPDADRAPRVCDGFYPGSASVKGWPRINPGLLPGSGESTAVNQQPSLSPVLAEWVGGPRRAARCAVALGCGTARASVPGAPFYSQKVNKKVRLNYIQLVIVHYAVKNLSN